MWDKTENAILTVQRAERMQFVTVATFKSNNCCAEELILHWLFDGSISFPQRSAYLYVVVAIVDDTPIDTVKFLVEWVRNTSKRWIPTTKQWGKAPTTKTMATPPEIANRHQRTTNPAARVRSPKPPRNFFKKAIMTRKKKKRRYKVFKKEHLATLGESKYVPDVGVSVNKKLKRLNPMDFAPDPHTEADYSKKIGEDPEGKLIYEADPIKKKLAEQMQEEELKIKVKQYTIYCADMQNLFAVAYGQLDDDKMKDNNKVQSNEGHTNVHSETNLLRAFRKLISCGQRSSNLSQYSKNVTDAFKVLFKSLGGSIIYDKTVTQEIKHGSHTLSTYVDYVGFEDMNHNKAVITTGVEQSFLATILIEGCDEETILTLISIQELLGTQSAPTAQRGSNNTVPTDLVPRTATGNIITTWTDPTLPNKTSTPPALLLHTRKMHIQQTLNYRSDNSWSGRAIDNGTPNISKSDNTAVHLSQNMEQLLAQTQGGVNPNWILLNSKSLSNLISNQKMLMTIHCNSVSTKTNQIASLPGFQVAWFYEQGITNILSLALVTDHQLQVTMDSAVNNALLYVHQGSGTRQFARSSCNLYYCDMMETSGTILAITTTDGQKKLYSDLNC
eukprot:jgi/Psemu1/27259/gm1.27259_g